MILTPTISNALYLIGVTRLELRRKDCWDYAVSHLEKNRERARQWYKQNPEKALERIKKWRKLNSERVRRYQQQWQKINPLATRIRARIWWALQRKNLKSAHTLELLGCSIQYLRDWLVWQFQPGMTWENYGQWHIDHIKPCASFDLSDPKEQRECFHFSNLQPLWAKDNLKKGAKRGY